jgi:hypothetical protein
MFNNDSDTAVSISDSSDFFHVRVLRAGCRMHISYNAIAALSCSVIHNIVTVLQHELLLTLQACAAWLLQ